MALSLDIFRDTLVQAIPAGECVIEQGAQTGRLFILIEGKVEVEKDGKSVAISGHQGDIFGDMSALLNVPHTTSVRAVVDSKFYVVPDARQFLEEHPAVCIHLCELLARRLISVNDYLVNLKEQFDGHDHLSMVDQVLDKLINRHPRQRIPSRSGTVPLPEVTD